MPGTTGGWLIRPTTVLPSLIDGNTIIDGATQTANQNLKLAIMNGVNRGNLDGILLENNANGNVIAYNVISGNFGQGIILTFSGTDNYMIHRNTIGLDPNVTIQKN